MRYISLLLLLLCAFSMASPVYSQQKKKPKKEKSKKTDDDDSDDGDLDDIDDEEEEHISLHDIHNAFSLELPMNRNGSGTAWNPDRAPMFYYNIYVKKWWFSCRGDVFMRLNAQDAEESGKLASRQADVTNLLMFTGQRQSGLDGLLHFNAAFSTDVFFSRGNGLAQLFQNHDAWNRRLNTNRQLPNNIVSELSVSYAWSFDDRGDMFLYGGYPAEPALGPVSTAKRPSGSFIATAPLSRDWYESTQISYGTLTYGLRWGKFKFEGSLFTGRTPDVNNYNFNLPFFNSKSVRISFSPNAQWTTQISRGEITSPDPFRPGANITRTTASATYVQPIDPRKFFTYSIITGRNEVTGLPASHAAMFETTLKKKRMATYGRAEWMQKTAYDLGLSPIGFKANTVYNVSAATAGGCYDIFYLKYFTIGAGAQATVHLADAALDKLYGQFPVSGQIYLHLFPILQ